MLDSYGRDINYLRISVTDLCNLSRRYCTPLNGCGKREQKDILSLSEIKRLVGECIMPKEGIFTRVIKGGIINNGDTIYLE